MVSYIPQVNDLSGFFIWQNTGHRLTWQAYHRLADIHGYLDYVGQTYPDVASVGVLGSSVEGRPLKYIKISSGVPNAKAFWIDGGL